MIPLALLMISVVIIYASTTHKISWLDWPMSSATRTRWFVVMGLSIAGSMPLGYLMSVPYMHAMPWSFLFSFLAFFTLGILIETCTWPRVLMVLWAWALLASWIYVIHSAKRFEGPVSISAKLPTVQD